MFEFQPTNLRDSIVSLEPLLESDFDLLYAVACDPLIWAQHPNPDRYKEEVFRNYFKGAIESGGAFLIRDIGSGEVIGCSRFYDYSSAQQSVMIGYTFFSRKVWGQGHNAATKKLMLDHALRFVDQVLFHVGEKNLRSRRAMGKIGAELIGTEEVAYYGEPVKTNCVYRMVRGTRF